MTTKQHYGTRRSSRIVEGPNGKGLVPSYRGYVSENDGTGWRMVWVGEHHERRGEALREAKAEAARRA